MNKVVAEKLEKQEEATEPWTPASHLSVDPRLLRELESKGLKPKWKRTKNLDTARLEGWEPLTSNHPVVKATIIDGTPLTSLIEKRELTLCVMPITKVKSRTKYYTDMANGALKDSVERFKESANMGSHGNKAYGSIVIKDSTDK